MKTETEQERDYFCSESLGQSEARNDLIVVICHSFILSQMVFAKVGCAFAPALIHDKCLSAAKCCFKI